MIKWFNSSIDNYVQMNSKNVKRVAVIIGADSAVGYSLATQLIKKNFHVVIGVKSSKTGL